MIKQKEIFGKISKGLFVPTSFQNLQRQTVLNYFTQNEYVEDVQLQQLQIVQKTDEYLKTILPTDQKPPVKFS